MTCSYSGNATGIVGQVVGPDTAGAIYEAVAAEYDAELDRTRVKFKPILPNDTRSIVPDEAGFLRIAEESSE